MRLWLAIVVICGLVLMLDAESIVGSIERCYDEGKIINVDKRGFNCHTCICKNGNVECHPKQCPTVEGCHMLMENKKEGCCEKCKGCIHQGVMRESGSEWRDLENPCRVFSCKAGVVTETEEICYTPCSNPLPPKEGTCCPTCPGCRVNGQVVSSESTVRDLADPCLRYQCSEGRLTCSKKACPVLNCLPRAIDNSTGECCPVCKGSRKLMGPPGGQCLLGAELWEPGQNFRVDRCTVCQCTNGTVVCKRYPCQILDCALEDQAIAPGKCCPHCTKQRKDSKCSYAGKTYEEGDTIQLDQCKLCSCKNNQIRCFQLPCQDSNKPCPANQKLVHLPGQCCPKCVESDKVCTVFGDPHYRTFDGKFFSFQGSCKYQLTADCVDNTFSIRVTNDARSTRTSSWTKTVSIKIKDLKINLGERRRVKINGVKVAIPHESKGVSVTESDDSILVETSIGVKVRKNVLWDGNSFLEVSVPPKYKGRLCGLCGNYNSLAKDDFTTRNGQVVYDADKFGASWRVGGKRACTRLSDPPHCPHTLPQKKYRERLCKPLRADIFAPCRKKVHYQMYFKSCMTDMCECPSRRCYCESFTAYAHECNRLGVSLPDWRTRTGCLARH